MKIFRILLFLITYNFAFGQSDFDKDQQLAFNYLSGKDLNKFMQFIDDKFIQSPDDSKKVIGYVYLSVYYSDNTDEFGKPDILQKAKEIVDRTKDPLSMAYVDYGYAKYYFKIKKNDLFIKAINQSINTFSKYPNENFILSRLYTMMQYYKSGNILEKNVRSDAIMANKYALKSKNNLLIYASYHNLVYYYLNMYYATEEKKYLDSAKINGELSYKHAELLTEPSLKTRTLIAHYVNYGGVLALLSDDPSEGLKVYKKGLELSKKDNRYQEFTALIYCSMGRVYTHLDDPKSALPYYLEAYEITKKNEDIYTKNKILVLNSLSSTYQSLNDLPKALQYEREVQNLILKDARKQFDNNTKALELFYETEKKNQQIRQLADTNKIYAKQRILYIIIILLIAIGILFLITLLLYKQKLNKQKTSLLENEKIEAELMLKYEQEEKQRLKVEQELLAIKQEQLQKQALAASLQLDHKNIILNAIKENLKNNSDFSLEKILKEESFTDNDFQEIQNIIKEVHPNFFKRINDASKNKLTKLDLKYAAYIYLNMENQQISSVLKVDSNTVRTTKYRLKQKLGLEKEDDLTAFIQSLI